MSDACLFKESYGKQVLLDEPKMRFIRRLYAWIWTPVGQIAWKALPGKDRLRKAAYHWFGDLCSPNIEMLRIVEQWSGISMHQWISSDSDMPESNADRFTNFPRLSEGERRAAAVASRMIGQRAMVMADDRQRQNDLVDQIHRRSHHRLPAARITPLQPAPATPNYSFFTGC